MIRVKVGDVEVRTDETLTLKQVRALLREAAGIAALLSATSDEPTAPIGFSAIVERLPEELAAPDYDDED